MKNVKRDLMILGLGAAVGYIANLSAKRKDTIKKKIDSGYRKFTEFIDDKLSPMTEEGALAANAPEPDLDYDFSLVPMTFGDQTSAYLTVSNVVKYIREDGYVTFAEVMLERSINEPTKMPEIIPDIWREFGWTDAEVFVPYKTASGLWKITDVLPHRLYKVEFDNWTKETTTEQ